MTIHKAPTRAITVALALLASAVPASSQENGPPDVDITLLPGDGPVEYLPTAPRISGGAMGALIYPTFEIVNREADVISLRRAVVRLLGDDLDTSQLIELPRLIRPARKRTVIVGQPDRIVVEGRTPTGIEVVFFFDGFSEPVVHRETLAPHRNPVAMQSYAFPSGLEDLPEGQYWSGASGVHAGGNQRYAYDLRVVGKAADGTWSPHPDWDPDDGPLQNDDFLVWYVPVRAVADGVVVSCLDGIEDNEPGVRARPPGNHFVILHGTERVRYAHLQNGTVNRDLCREGGLVARGDSLGLAGNSGQSSGPHLHIHGGTGGRILPMLFNGLHAVSQGAETMDPRQLEMAVPEYPWVPVCRAGPPLDRGLLRPRGDITTFDEGRTWLSALGSAGRATFVGDFDGDGRSDVARSVGSRPTGTVRYDVLVSTSRGDGFDGAHSWIDAFAAEGPRPRAGDFDGDGRDDIIEINPPDRRGGEVVVSLSAGSSFRGKRRWRVSLLAEGSSAVVGDFDGDGRSDVASIDTDGVVRVARSSGIRFDKPTAWYQGPFAAPGVFRAGDFDGDGRADLARFDPGGAVYVLRSDGGSFVRPPNPGEIVVEHVPALSTWHHHFARGLAQIRVADVNGDGRSDLVGVTEEGAVRVATAERSRFGEASRWGLVPPGFRIAVGDFDGDCASDVVSFMPGRDGPLRVHRAGEGS